ncbi:COP23 domain-containing protein [Argonema antarcticum]|uniref:COP23 domain-containing protein n=1 Tax=Argonema antarcticum TaxID=2942763 RepID=UPI002012319F|nr:COP23 domain-containing protein [Argonema antarcticum]MCL1471945.1 COP23 domain-containing protein [Argonema antarcticum A004/B2]
MKRQLLTQILAAGSIALASGSITSQPSQAQSTTFFCGASQGKPATIAQTPRGNIPVIVWVSQYFTRSGFNPQARCEDVSSRFQSFYSQGALNFITAGIVNGQPVVCATGAAGGPCNNTNVLFTLKPGENAARVIQGLHQIRGGASRPLYEGTRRRSSSSSDSINVNDFLNNAPVEAEASASSPEPNNAAPAMSQPSSAPAGGNAW